MSLPSDSDRFDKDRAPTFRSPALVAALAAVFLGAVDLTIIATILPTMIADLGVNTADIDRYIWIVNGYLIAYIVAIPVFGRISDIIGRSPVFILSLTLFVTGSVVSALSGSLAALIAGRILQGAGGGGLLPAALALTADRFAGRSRIAAIGAVTAVDTLGWVTGPLWGASIVALFGEVDQAWRWVFWLHLPFAALCAWLFFARGERGHSRRRLVIGDFDVLGSILLALALISLNLALSSGSEIGTATETGLRALGGTPNPLARFTVPLLGLAVVTAAALVVQERRARLPVLPIHLFRIHSFTGAIVANVLLGGALMVGMVNVPVVVALLADAGDVSRTSALLLAPFTLMIAAGSLISGRVALRFGLRTSATLGVTLVVAGYCLTAAILVPDQYARIVAGLVIAGFGIGLALAPLSGSSLAVASAAERGAAASTVLVARLLGMTVGISTLTALGVRRLQVLTGRVEPIVRGADESTASFLTRQQAFIQEHAVPLSVQVISETFWLAAGLAILALLPIWFLREEHL